MSDDISIPRHAVSGSAPGRTSFTHSYRSRRTGMDGSTKMLLLAACALATVLVGGMAVWSFTGHKVAGVPTVVADIRPVRVKPENPGGMTAIGVGDPTSVGGSGAGDLAPAAEQPDPQALLAQQRATAPPKIASAAPAPPPSPAVSVQAPVPAPSVSVQAPVPAPSAAAPAAPAVEAARPPQATGGPMVQLAALDSEAAATAEWQRLARKLPDLLGDRHPSVQRTEVGGKPFWRLRTGGFTDVADAAEFCKRARVKGIGCSLANF